MLGCRREASGCAWDGVPDNSRRRSDAVGAVESQIHLAAVVFFIHIHVNGFYAHGVSGVLHSGVWGTC